MLPGDDMLLFRDFLNSRPQPRSRFGHPRIFFCPPRPLESFVLASAPVVRLR